MTRTPCSLKQPQGSPVLSTARGSNGSRESIKQVPAIDLKVPNSCPARGCSLPDNISFVQRCCTAAFG